MLGSLPASALIHFIGARRDPSPPVGQYQNLRDGKLRLSDAMFAQMMGWNKRVMSRVVAHTQAIVRGLLWMQARPMCNS